jgi:hypothetical protein
MKKKLMTLMLVGLAGTLVGGPQQVASALGSGSPIGVQRAASPTFRIGVRVTDPVGTTVLVRWRVSCANGGIALKTHGEFRAEVPVQRQVPQSLAGATSCHIRAVAWNVGHPHGDHPVVETWVVAA